MRHEETTIIIKTYLFTLFSHTKNSIRSRSDEMNQLVRFRFEWDIEINWIVGQYIRYSVSLQAVCTLRRRTKSHSIDGTLWSSLNYHSQTVAPVLSCAVVINFQRQRSNKIRLHLMINNPIDRGNAFTINWWHFFFFEMLLDAVIASAISGAFEVWSIKSNISLKVGCVERRQMNI